MKQIILCADDFAQSPAISAGILKLVASGRLNAVSCMTESPHWPELAGELKACGTQHEAGLHFNLTHNFAGKHLPVSQLIRDSLTGNVNAKLVRSLFVRQWQAFVRHYGRPPAFVDGHQHVHSFPVIREIVIQETAKRNPEAWIRLPHSSTRSIKSLMIDALACGFQRSIENAGLKFNRNFAGFRSFDPHFNFGQFFRKLLSVSPDKTLIMCHPGLDADDSEDPIALCRQGEMDYLQSGRFLLDLATNNITLGLPTGDTPSPRRSRRRSLFPV